ncbi:MAG: shikimate dehydrogenase [Bacteroidales bacterium]|nr:shikimate dehydrogenase [Candidatus Physcousia equi]
MTQQLYGLIGHPLGHSFSKKFFTEKFEREGIPAQYINFDIPDPHQLLDVVRDHPTLSGLNCTIPHKQAIIPMLDELSQEAQRIGAVNVIKITRREGKNGNFHLKGYNSDIIGFTQSLKPLLKPIHRRALVLGTGGASKAICLGLETLGIDWQYVSRTKATYTKGNGEEATSLTYEEVNEELLRLHPLVVNCSPVGMHPFVDQAPLLPYEAMNASNLLFDLVYNPLETLFLKRGAAQGATTKNGLEMLYLQALASWDFWNNA